MADTLPPEQRASYAAMIDKILENADLNMISAKAIRQAMQERISYDIAPQKAAITEIIMERFDRAQSQVEPDTEAPPPPPAPTTTNGNHSHVQTSQKRKAESDESDESEATPRDTPVQKKAKKVTTKTEADSDEAFAARLQAELNAEARPTRGGAVQKKRAVVKKSKKKSAAKVGSDVDSDVDGETGEPREKKGAFHKPYSLSEPLAAMLGENVLSRPQTVKKIWAYVKERDLQDPADKRQFRCDPAMRAVFKQEKVHMFTMNKLLGSHLYPVEEQ